MTDTKQYRLSTDEPGPRGVETAAHGLVMVAPTPPGAKSAVTATLTDDEATNAKRQGIKLKELKVGGIAGVRSENLPPAGQIDPNHPDAKDLLAPKAAKTAGSKDEDGKAAEPKPLGKMNRAELDAEVEKEKANGFVLPDDATTNAQIADALEAHRAPKS